ncbi:hypothetical protein VNO77_38980 [Canavalia gladiata]|uniref:Uncharacterized protein n=1 Tax=Canavalia gladiata TaxID=3824 RepID=A0AAN9K9L0_CANGL
MSFTTPAYFGCLKAPLTQSDLERFFFIDGDRSWLLEKGRKLGANISAIQREFRHQSVDSFRSIAEEILVLPEARIVHASGGSFLMSFGTRDKAVCCLVSSVWEIAFEVTGEWPVRGINYQSVLHEKL